MQFGRRHVDYNIEKYGLIIIIFLIKHKEPRTTTIST